MSNQNFSSNVPLSGECVPSKKIIGHHFPLIWCICTPKQGIICHYFLSFFPTGRVYNSSLNMWFFITQYQYYSSVPRTGFKPVYITCITHSKRNKNNKKLSVGFQILAVTQLSFQKFIWTVRASPPFKWCVSILSYTLVSSVSMELSFQIPAM